MEEPTKKELRDERREERKREEAKRVNSKRMKKIVVWVAVIVAVMLIGWFLYSSLKGSGRELSEDRSRSVPLQEASHIEVGAQHEPYNSNPPTSGPHWADPVHPGVFDKSQPDEGMIHSLEHGMVWVSHKSSIPDPAKEILNKIAREHSGIVLTERDSNDADIALASWGRLDTFNLGDGGSVDEGRILDFISRYFNKGPEKVPFMTGKEY